MGSPAARRAVISRNWFFSCSSNDFSGWASTLASEPPVAAARSRRASRASMPLARRTCSMVKRILRVLRSSGFFGKTCQLLGLVLGGERVDDLVDLAVHDALDLVEREVDAVVGDPALRKVVGADALRAIARADQQLARRGGLRLLLGELLVADARRQHAERLLAVLVLGARVLAFDHDAGGQVRDADRGVGLVDVLAAGDGR